MDWRDEIDVTHKKTNKQRQNKKNSTTVFNIDNTQKKYSGPNLTLTIPP